MPAITLRNVTKRYDSGAPAVAGLDLEIGDGEFMCLLGPSGCGKTTTLRMVAGLENLSAGEIAVGDRIVDSVAKSLFVPPERRDMGLVFQSYALWPHLTVERNTDFGLRLRKMPRAERQARVTAVLKTLGIEHYRDRYPSQLSGGQQQRVALARMLAVNPKVLLLDEPLSNLDARLRLEMRAELKRIHSAFGTTIMLVTHDQWEAMTLASRIAVMDGGCLQQMGTPQEIYDRPANRFVAEFVGNLPINLIDLEGTDTGLEGQARTWLRRHLGNADFGAVGIRPEALGLDFSARRLPEKSFGFEATLTGVLPTGGSTILELRAGDKPIFATAARASGLVVGERLYAHAPAAALHVFDRSGARLQRADDAFGSETGRSMPDSSPSLAFA